MPLAVRSGWSDTDNPVTFAIHLFPGAENVFTLYEDDGRETSCLTAIRQEWTAESWQVTVDAAQGESGFLPQERVFELLFRGIQEGASAEAALDGRPVDVTAVFDEEMGSLKVTAPAKKAGQRLVVTVTVDEGDLQLPESYRQPASRRLVRAFKIDSWVKMRMDRKLPAILDDPGLLARYEFSLTGEQIRALVEVLTGSGH